MRKLALTILTFSLFVSACVRPAAAQSNDGPLCPAGYVLVGRLCHDGATGDVVVPNREL